MRYPLTIRRLASRLVHRRFAAALGAAASVVVAASAMLGWWPVAVSTVALMHAGLIVLVVDVRSRVLWSRRASNVINAVERAEQRLHDAERRVNDAVRRLDNVTSRTLAVSEEGRVATSDQLADLREKQLTLQQKVDRGFAQVARRQLSAGDPVTQIEAMFQLYSRVRPRAMMPASGGWAMNAANILLLLDVVEHSRPNLVLELGGGTSSLWLGYALEQLGAGRVVSIDHDPEYAELTRARIGEHGLEDVVEIRVAPLIDDVVPLHGTPWYDPAAFKDLSNIDLLVVDGPTKTTGPLARYPALPAISAQLSNAYWIVLDDAERADETEIVMRWIDETPGLRKVNQYSSKYLACLRSISVETITN